MSYLDYNLHSCPFCDADVKENSRICLSYDDNNVFSVFCLCGASGPKKDSKEKAIMAWNSRVYASRDEVWDPFDFQADNVDFKGKLKSFGFSCIMQTLSSENKTGVLQFSKGSEISALCLKEGQVIAASSNYGPKLGEILFDEGLVSLERLQEILKKAKVSGKRTGEMVLDLGFVDQDTLKGIIGRQIRDTIQELIRWDEGSFQYRDGQIEFDKDSIENISIMGVLLDALRISDEIADGKT